jgi:hypothetical protein
MSMPRFFILVLMLVSPSVSSAIKTSPPHPLDNQSTRLLLTYDTACGETLPEPLVSRIDREIRVEVALPPSCVLTPTGNGILVADLGELQQGEYDVRIVRKSDSTLLEEAAFEVGKGHIIEIFPSLPTAADPVSFTITGPFCYPLIFHPETPRTDNVFQLVYGNRCPTIDPNYRAGRFSLNRETPLPAGRYRIQLAGVLTASLDFEVLPDPLQFQNGRFEVDVEWRTAAGETGKGRPAQKPTVDSALFWFFSPTNWELMVKVLDGCQLNGHFLGLHRGVDRCRIPHLGARSVARQQLRNR